MFIAIDLSKVKREVPFPFPVSRAGMVHYFRQEMMEMHYDSLEICLRLSGETEYTHDEIDGRSYDLEMPQLIVKRPGMCHRYSFKDKREAIYFIYSPEVAKRLINLNLLPDEPIQPIKVGGDLQLLVERFHGLLTHSQEFSVADKIDLCCFAMVEEALFMRRLDRQYDADLNIDKIKRIASFIQMNLNHPLDLSELACKFGMSERSLFRNWKRCFHSTPHEYILKERLRRACYLLENTNQSIAEIAMETAFCNDKYFSSKFKAVFGHTPSEHRRRQDIG